MDPLSITVSILTLATFCVQSSVSLYRTIDGLKSRKQDVRYLKTEVGNLNVVLQALEKNIEETTENFEVLRMILQQCGQACKDFEKAVLEAVEDCGGPLQEIKAWAKMRYLGSDINKFRKLIGSYKATMTIALADSNLRTSRVTRQLLEEYTDMTKDTASDLEEQIAELSTKLEILQSGQTRRPSDNLDTELRIDPTITKQALGQKASLEQCLIVCHNLLDYIEKGKLSVLEDAASVKGTMKVHDPAEGANLLAPRLTTDALAICTHNLNATAQQLRDLQESNESTNRSDEARIMQHLDSTRQCLAIVGKAQQHRFNTFENIATAEDSFQTVVSTIGDLIKANGLTVGARSVNIMGQMNDETLQKMMHNFRPRKAWLWTHDKWRKAVEKKFPCATFFLEDKPKQILCICASDAGTKQAKQAGYNGVTDSQKSQKAFASEGQKKARRADEIELVSIPCDDHAVDPGKDHVNVLVWLKKRTHQV